MVARRHLLVLSVLLVGACSAEPAAPAPVPQTPLKPPTLVNEVVPPQDVLTVVRDVVDGRTVEFADGTKVRIALLAEPKECFAKAALDFARSTLLASSVRFTALTPGEVNLELEDGTDYAVLAVRQGALKPEGVDGGPMIAARDEATAAKRGLWGPPCEGSDTTEPAPPTTTTTKAPPPPPRTTTPPPPAKACAIAYRVTGQWQGGFQASVTVRNTGTAAVNGWTLLWVFANGDGIRDMWNATGRQYGPIVSATNANYNQQIAAGASVQIGFNGSSRGTHTPPTTFSFNGLKCSVE
ncbi:cellulose binding domain-containing protein [Lentzea sp. BCCO 10_0061]|uniref:Cellulose binding domain-containing protein n=1 Tax=Lentzea sokolovensis TaxID=3095429 RepID=A0ABU4UTG7_9PSEU|nr:cellulose binding domain-containing protein [Lentzea sp. BCCO 10_0061]MDX8142545.1 cellulose binding domain-containing protein [Lentzea sp. BCCO 10_0061]